MYKLKRSDVICDEEFGRYVIFRVAVFYAKIESVNIIPLFFVQWKRTSEGNHI